MSAADGVGLGRAQGLSGGEVRLERLTGAGVSDGQHGGQSGGVEKSGGDAGLDGQGDGSDVAAGNCDVPGGCQLVALSTGARLAVVQELGHAVGPGSGVVRAVEDLPCLLAGQAVVRPAVDEQGGVTARRELLEGCRDGSGGPVRQGQDDDVVLGEDLRLGGLDDSVRQGQQVRMVVAESTAGGRGCGECACSRPTPRWRSAHSPQPRGGP